MVIDCKDFNLTHTFECGQCFRWNQLKDGRYIGVVNDKVISLKEQNGKIIADCDDEALLIEYFDLNRDYKSLKEKLSSDKILKEATSFGYGIRILKQSPWETLISFIISSNNNIPRIKKIIGSLCENFGEKIGDYYAFPTAEALCNLTESDLDIIKSGYRAKFIFDAAKKVASKEIDLNSVYKMSSDEGREYLKQIKGVGDKVADCVLLFAYHKLDVFPKDVWIKRVLYNLYSVPEKDFDTFVKQKFGELGGFAQQYLFYYERENKQNFG